MTNEIFEKTDNFFIQKIKLTNIREPRFEFFANMCRNKKIMHIGCADAMVFDVSTNLHIFLSKLDQDGFREDKLKKANEMATAASIAAKNASQEFKIIAADASVAANSALDHAKDAFNHPTIIDGLDINVAATAELAAACPGNYFTSYDQAKDNYDIVLVPEVMEHVLNVGEFLTNVFSINSKEYLFTVPSMGVAQIFCDDIFCLELIHPDHKYWFSPFTLYNVIKPHMDGFNIQMYFLENKSQIGIRLWKDSK